MRISLFCILCLLLGACSNEEMIPSTSEGGEECAFQFLLRVPGTIDVETKAGTEPEILKLGDTNIYNVWILQFKKDGTELLKAVFADRNSITAVPGSSSTTYDQLLIQLMKDDMRFKNETSEFYIIVNAEDMNATEVTAKLFVKEGGIPTSLSVTELMAKTKSIIYLSHSIFQAIIFIICAIVDIFMKAMIGTICQMNKRVVLIVHILMIRLLKIGLLKHMVIP